MSCRARMRGQYSIDRRVRPCRSGPRTGTEGTPARFISCALCRAHALICSCCDRGQIYCSPTCAREARHRAQRAASCRYQRSRRGRFAHALRARRYRARWRIRGAQQKNVTHQGSPPQPADDLLPADPAAHQPPSTGDLQGRMPVISERKRCCSCGRSCPEFIRRGFLRRRGPRTAVQHSPRGVVHGDPP